MIGCLEIQVIRVKEGPLTDWLIRIFFYPVSESWLKSSSCGLGFFFCVQKIQPYVLLCHYSTFKSMFLCPCQIHSHSFCSVMQYIYTDISILHWVFGNGIDRGFVYYHKPNREINKAHKHQRKRAKNSIVRKLNTCRQYRHQDVSLYTTCICILIPYQ